MILEKLKDIGNRVFGARQKPALDQDLTELVDMNTNFKDDPNHYLGHVNRRMNVKSDETHPRYLNVYEGVCGLYRSRPVQRVDRTNVAAMVRLYQKLEQYESNATGMEYMGKEKEYYRRAFREEFGPTIRALTEDVRIANTSERRRASGNPGYDPSLTPK